MEVWINNEVDDASNASTSRWLSAVWWDDDDGGGGGGGGDGGGGGGGAVVITPTIDYFFYCVANLCPLIIFAF